MKTLAVIPARYQSTRLPGKPLGAIQGKPMIQWVWERCLQALPAESVIVATDDQRICKVVEEFGGRAIMTSEECWCGADRIAEVARGIPAEIYINVQGDEPFVRPEDITLVEQVLRDYDADVATLRFPITEERAKSEHAVKVVCDRNGRALYFSRLPIPFCQRPGMAQRYQQLGLYAYTREFMLEFPKLDTTVLAEAERLEHLLFMEHGYEIQVGITEAGGPAVDTLEDLARANAYAITL